MTSARAKATHRWSTLALRAFWLFMILGHAPAILNALAAGVGGTDSWFKAGLLLGAQLFFILKLFDPAWLRCGLTHRAQFAVVVLILLLHVGVFERVLVDGQALPPTFQLLTIGGSVGALVNLSRRETAVVGTLRQRAARRRFQAAWRSLWNSLRLDDLPPRCLALTCPCAPHRAPPL